MLVLNQAQPTLLKGTGGTRLALLASHWYRLVEGPDKRGGWQVRTTGYQYTLLTPEDREIIAYHWHPESRGQFASPHLHLGPGALVARRDLAEAHLPTGRVAFEDLLRLGIEEFGVQALRPDWAAILERTRRARGE